MPNTIRPIIDVYIVDQTLNEFSWAAVLDCFPREEESRTTKLDAFIFQREAHHLLLSPLPPSTQPLNS